jgi:hypothetical protein
MLQGMQGPGAATWKRGSAVRGIGGANTVGKLRVKSQNVCTETLKTI